MRSLFGVLVRNHQMLIAAVGSNLDHLPRGVGVQPEGLEIVLVRVLQRLGGPKLARALRRRLGTLS